MCIRQVESSMMTALDVCTQALHLLVQFNLSMLGVISP
jgi:hypothetical protein